METDEIAVQEVISTGIRNMVRNWSSHMNLYKMFHPEMSASDFELELRGIQLFLDGRESIEMRLHTRDR